MPGLSGSVALANVARMPADGSVMTLSASAAIAGNPFLYKNVRYDSVKDFEPIGLIYDAPLVLMVNSTLPIHSVKDLIAYVKASPGKVNYSTPVSHRAWRKTKETRSLTPADCWSFAPMKLRPTERTRP